MKNDFFHHIPESAVDNDAVASLLATCPSLAINSHNWQIGKDLPEVSVRGGWNSNELALLFEVTEQESLRRFKTLNAPVYKDSCVEFFIQPDPESPLYCNFEFNSLGTLLSQVGTGREEREWIKSDEAEGINTSVEYRSLTQQSTGGHWKLLVRIPAELLSARGITLAAEREYRCNFYKCGDDLRDFHYLSWNPVKSENPDFHRPEYFGRIKLKSEN